MDYEKMAVIDLEMGKKLAGNNKTLALDILTMFMTNLPAEAKEINALCQANHFSELQKQVHKMRGGVAYCGLPRFKSFLADMEAAIKNNATASLPSFLDQFNIEVALLLEHYAGLSNATQGKKTAI